MKKVTVRHQCQSFRLDVIRDHITPSNVFLGFCAILLSAGTFYMIDEIYTDFMEGTTSITLDNSMPNVVDIPALTICAPVIFSPAGLAELYPEFDSIYQDFQRKQFEDPFWQANETLEQAQNRLDNFVYYESMALREYSALDVIANKSLRAKEINLTCRFHMLNLRSSRNETNDDGMKMHPIDCGDLVPAFESIYESSKCFTYFLNDMPTPEDFLARSIERAELVVPTDGSLTNLIRDRNFSKVLLKRLYDRQLPLLEYIVQTKFFKNKMFFDLNPSIEVEARFDGTEWSFLALYGIMLGLHPASVLPDKMEQGIYFLQPNAYYELIFAKQILRLPEHCSTLFCDPDFYKVAADVTVDAMDEQRPIVTTDEWKWQQLQEEVLREEKLKEKNNKSPKVNRKFNNRGECMSMCIKNYVVKRRGCANYYSVIIESIFRDDINTDGSRYADVKNTSQFICAHDEQNYTEFLEAQDNCNSQCPQSCWQSFYSLWGVSSLIQPTTTEFITKVSIRIAPKNERRMTYQPTISAEEMFGYLGGYLGIGLGLSLFAFINFGVRFVFLVFSWCARQKKCILLLG